MNRRAFLKLFVGTVAVATLPIPKFLLKDERDTAFENYGAWKGEAYNAQSGTLTIEMIEEASKRAMENMGKPDMIIMSERTFKRFLRWQVVYENT